MTTDASVATTDTHAADPRQPRTVRLAVLAAFVTAVLAGPVTMVLFVAGQAVQGMPLFGFEDVADLVANIAVFTMYAALLGLVGSVPAAIINTSSSPTSRGDGAIHPALLSVRGWSWAFWWA